MLVASTILPLLPVGIQMAITIETEISKCVLNNTSKLNNPLLFKKILLISTSSLILKKRNLLAISTEKVMKRQQ